jgi:ABC-type transporter Mla subunit MlaD
MAPHDTNTPREARRHRVPLIGIAVCVLLVVLGFFWWVGRASQGRDEVPATEEPAAATAPAPAPAN